VPASVNLPLHHKVQKFSFGTVSPEWSRKKGRKTVCMCVSDDNDVIQVSKPLSVTRSAYLFIIIDGQLSAYSLITGQKLLRLDYSNSLLSDGKRSLVSVLHLVVILVRNSRAIHTTCRCAHVRCNQTHSRHWRRSHYVCGSMHVCTAVHCTHCEAPFICHKLIAYRLQWQDGGAAMININTHFIGLC